MKVYPLIYSRTKHQGYISGFLVRPEDIDFTKAVSYVNTAIENIKYTSGVRCAVFSAGQYVVYGGTACRTPQLLEKLGEKINGVDYQEYQTDEADRPLVFFIGFAVKKSDYKGNIPDVDLLETYKIYLDYLKHQFYEVNTDTEITEGIELNEIPCSSGFIPQCSESVDRISILKNYNAENYQDIMNYYFKQIMENPDKEISFVSDILPDDVKLSIPYSCFSLAEGSVETCIAKLKQQQQKKVQPVQEVKAVQRKQNIGYNNPDSNVSFPKSQQWDDGIRKPDTPSSYGQRNQQYRLQPENEKKNNTPESGLIVLAVVIILIILLIILFKK